MFVYDIGVVDFWKGMIPLPDYIRKCYEENMKFQGLEEFHEADNAYLSCKELKKFLIKCFIEIKRKKTYWEGDIRSKYNIFISGIPREDDDPYKLIAFKQNNNGHCFCISEFPLDMVYTSISEFRESSKTNLLDWVDESYELVEKIFYEALHRPINSINDDQGINDSMSNIFNEKQSDIKESIKQNKFDLSQYDPIPQ